jgi:hypothetical protein
MTHLKTDATTPACQAKNIHIRYICLFRWWLLVKVEKKNKKEWLKQIN